MACSKFFSGDLPELINEVIQYFHYDYKTLYSCICVNRLWCRLAIPLLWKDPFSIKDPKNYHFIEIYLHNLNEDDKTKLDEYIINNGLVPPNTLFNYPGFIQLLDTRKLSNSIEKWVDIVISATNSQQRCSYYVQKILLPSQLSNFKKLVFKSLFQVFIKNEVNLHSFEITMFLYKEIEYFDEIFELMLQNPNFICNIKNFKIDFNKASENTKRFSKFLHSNCNSISSLCFQFGLYYNSFPITEECFSLSQVISSQNNLRKILLGYNFPFRQSLLSLKNPNCSNTLNTIIFYYVDFKNIIVLTEVFNQLNVLESIHIIYCRSLDSKFIQQIDNITKPFKLRSLFLDEVGGLLEPLIQKSSNYLENFGSLNNDESQQLCQLIITYCGKIKFLGRIRLGRQSIHLVLNLIENITQNLNHLTIDAFCFNRLDYNRRAAIEYSSVILQNLGHILPYKLKYLHLVLGTINASDLKVFLKNSQNTFIEKLLIRNRKREESKNIFPYIEEFIMKNKRVKYFAFTESFYGIINDLSFQKYKVKEFELYDIQVLHYKELLINIYDFIKQD
jgi:hypothetical protein